VELRALCNEVPRTPPGPEGSNGTGNTSGAADHPKFLASSAPPETAPSTNTSGNGVYSTTNYRRFASLLLLEAV